MSPAVDAFFDLRTQTVTYLVHDPASRAAMVIDPVLDFDPRGGRLWTESVDKVLALAEAKGLTVERVLETHPHADHLSGAQAVALRTGARVGAGARMTETLAEFAPRFGASDVPLDGSGFDDLYADDEAFKVGGLSVRVLATPGHTPACVTYLVGDAAFVGDLVFMPDFGTPRCDFPGGCARTLYRSIARVLALPPETRLFVGHDYPSGAGRAEPAWETTVGAQRESNKHLLAADDEEAFYALRRARDAGLDPPTLLLAALQVNIRAGHMPPPDTDGRVYLRLPVSGAR
jgi:glyoxylase-like metal-dependent hydrolase (beta-lactamase superfamily II)